MVVAGTATPPRTVSTVLFSGGSHEQTVELLLQISNIVQPWSQPVLFILPKRLVLLPDFGDNLIPQLPAVLMHLLPE